MHHLERLIANRWIPVAVVGTWPRRFLERAASPNVWSVITADGRRWVWRRGEGFAPQVDRHRSVADRCKTMG